MEKNVKNVKNMKNVKNVREKTKIVKGSVTYASVDYCVKTVCEHILVLRTHVCRNIPIHETKLVVALQIADHRNHES